MRTAPPTRDTLIVASWPCSIAQELTAEILTLGLGGTSVRTEWMPYITPLVTGPKWNQLTSGCVSDML